MNTKNFTIVVLASVVMALGSVAATAQQRTQVKDANAARMLLGRHLMSLQWISWDYFGTATVTNRRGVYTIKGRQDGRGQSKGDYVTIDGTILEILDKEFVFEGKIVTRISHINGGEPCVRDGIKIFRVTGKRKYWRLVEMENPCDQAADYVDIYFR